MSTRASVEELRVERDTGGVVSVTSEEWDDASLDQNAGNTAASGFLRGEQESAVDVVAVQFAYRF